MKSSVLVLGDALTVLSSFPADCVQTVVTSPPYWGLRDYGIAGQIGLEESVLRYIDSLADVFDQVFRVLRPDGTLWLNIGDSYTSGNRGSRAPDKKNPARAMGKRPPTPEGLKRKDLVGVPWRLAFALQVGAWFSAPLGVRRLGSITLTGVWCKQSPALLVNRLTIRECRNQGFLRKLYDLRRNI